MARFALSFLLAAVALLASSAFANNATSCGTAGYNAKITSVSVTPATPVKGQPVALTSSGSLTAAVSNGVSELVVKLDGVQLFTHAGTTCGNTQITFPLDFGTATLDGLVCPAAAGSAISPGMTLTLPTAAPSGTYDVTIDAKDNSSNEIYCLQAVFDL